jgi:hypothetical protein
MKSKKIYLIMVLVFLALVFAVQASMAEPVGTGFTYQGRLLEDSNAPTDLYDMQFRLFNSVSDGSQIGDDVNLPDVNVIDGYFTILLDFNDFAFDGNSRWLQVSVRYGELEDPNIYTELSPRQEITAAPYAQYALTAGMVDMPIDLSGSGTVPVISGTSTGDGQAVYGLHDVSGNEGYIGGSSYGVYGQSENGTGVYGQSTSGHAGYFDGNAVVTDDLIVEGNVGIGTSTLSHKLHVVGDANITGSLYAGSGSTVLFVDDTSDRVGIGTTSPVEKLSVAGTIESTSGGIKFPDASVQTTSATVPLAELETLIASLQARIAELENPPGWGMAELIETDARSAGGPQLAVDPNGNAVAVWLQHDGTRYNIWSNRYVAGTGWGTAELIETDNSGDAVYPQVAVDPSGNGAAVWEQHDGTRYNIWSNRYVAGTGWGTAELVETDNTGDAGRPQVAVDPNRNAVAVWRQSDGTYNIWSNLYVAGTGWGTAELIETNAGHADYPQVAVDTSGNAAAVWEQHDGTRSNIWSNRYVAGTGWGTAELIEMDAGFASSPQVAVDPNGNAVAVWYQDDGTRYNIWSNRYVAGTGWGTAELIETDNTGDARRPQVTVDPNGNAVAVWKQDDGTYNIWSNRYVAGTGWGTAELIEMDASYAEDPQVAVDTSGNAVAVWWQNDGTRDNIWSNRYVAGTGWGTAELIETNAGGARWPQVAVDTSGNTVVVWQQHDGIRYNIWSNRYIKEE